MSPSEAQVTVVAGRVAASTRLLVVLATLLACLVALELGLRVSGRYRIHGLTGFHAPRGLSYGLKTNFSKVVSWPSSTFTVHTCELGFRAGQPGPRPLGNRPYYAVLGSSEVFGNGLDYEQTFVGVLAEKLKLLQKDVVNLAMPGQHLMEQDVIFRDFAGTASHPPKVVLICLNPLFIGGYDDNHTNAVVRMGELFDQHRWRLALGKMLLGNSLATYCFLRDGIRTVQARYFPSRDFSLAFYVERYSKAHRIRRPEKTEDFLRQLRGLEDYIRRLGATPVCVYFPTVGGFSLNELRRKGQLSGVEDFDTEFFVHLAEKHCEAEGIQFINAEPLLQQLYDEGKTLNFRGDAHFNGPTSLAIGEFLFESLQGSSQPEGR